jgi:thiosulfate/3-mercaptopyruvate sulfurtransferase
MLITPQQLNDALRTDPQRYVVCDVRHDLMKPSYGAEQYAKGHIPGAVFVSVDDDLSAHGDDAINGGRHPLPRPEVAAARLGQLGIDHTKIVVAYDDMGHNYSVRLWWMLQWLGHPQVLLLDGGYPRWLAERYAVDSTPVTNAAVAFDAHMLEARLNNAAMVDLHAVLHNLAQQRFTLVDARLAERYRGEVEAIDPIAGRIPGAINRPWKANLNADGTFKSAAQLAIEFRQVLGDVATENIVHQCGSGVTACHNIFAMQLAGLGQTKLYPGSYSEWVEGYLPASSSAKRPVLRG